MTKLFEFPDGTTIDLAKVWRVSPVIAEPERHQSGSFDVAIFIAGDASPARFTLTTFDSLLVKDTARRVARQVRDHLIERWGATE